MHWALQVKNCIERKEKKGLNFTFTLEYGEARIGIIIYNLRVETQNRGLTEQNQEIGQLTRYQGNTVSRYQRIRRSR